MKFETLILSAIVSLVSTAYAQNAPTTGTLIGKSDHDILDFECFPTEANKLQCEFVQILLADKNGGVTLEEELTNAPQLLQELEKNTSFCFSVAAYFRIQDPKQEASENDYLIAREFIENEIKIDNLHVEVRNLANEVLAAFHKVCTERNLMSAEELIKLTYLQATRTCSPTVNKYSQLFVKVSDDLWVVESTPSGTCGIINTSRFVRSEQFPELIWDYEASKIVTNKAANADAMCAMLDEGTYSYSIFGGPHYANCVFIDQ